MFVPAKTPTAVVTRLNQEIVRYLRTAAAKEKFLANGDKVVVYLHAWVRLKDSTKWVGGRFADGFVFRNGKIIQYLSFGQRAEALEWAGIKD